VFSCIVKIKLGSEIIAARGKLSRSRIQKKLPYALLIDRLANLMGFDLQIRR